MGVTRAVFMIDSEVRGFFGWFRVCGTVREQFLFFFQFDEAFEETNVVRTKISLFWLDGKTFN